MGYFFLFAILLCIKISYCMEQEITCPPITSAYNFFINPYRLKQRLPSTVLSVENNKPLAANFNTNSSLLGIGYIDGSVSIFDTKTHELSYKQKLADSFICALAFHTTRKLLVAATEKNALYFWYYDNSEQAIKIDQLDMLSCPIKVLFTPVEFIVEIRYLTCTLFKSLSTNRQTLRPLNQTYIYSDDLAHYAKEENDRLAIFSTCTEKPKHCIKKSTDSIKTMYFNHTGTYLVADDQDGTINFYNCKTGEHVRTLKMYTHSLVKSALCPNDRFLVTLHSNGIMLWQLKNLQQDQEIIQALTPEHRTLLNNLYLTAQASQEQSVSLPASFINDEAFSTLPMLLQHAINSYFKHNANRSC